MNTLPSDTLALYDSRNALVGVIRFAPREDDASKGECIFDVEPLDEGAPDDARWIAKRHFKGAGEHRFKVAPNGSVTVSQGDFHLVLDSDEEGGVTCRHPAPSVTGLWETDEEG